MKKFFTSIPLQKQGMLGSYHYEAVGNPLLDMDGKTSFPILAAVQGYVDPGEHFRLIAVMPDTEDGRRNLEALRAELSSLCTGKGIVCENGVELVSAPADEKVSSHVGIFQRLIDFVADEDELFACLTYGTKPQSMAVLMGVQYAYRVKKNTSLGCIVYGQVDRSEGEKPYIYDETALVQMDEIVRILADRHVENPKAVIDSLLKL